MSCRITKKRGTGDLMKGSRAASQTSGTLSQAPFLFIEDGKQMIGSAH